MGGYTPEYDISLKSGGVVQQYLPKEKYDVYPVLISKEKWVYASNEGKEYPIDKSDFSISVDSKKVSFDCVFNTIHGSPGEDGMMAAYFELIGMPQTSCGFYQAALTYNKRDLLATLKPLGIKMAKSCYLNKGTPFDKSDIAEKLGLPCFVKANKSGSSVGVYMVKTLKELTHAIANVFQYDNEIIIEAALEGTEVSAGVIQYKGRTKVLPLTEIISENGFFDYEAKYEGKSKEITPARIPLEVENKTTKIALFIYEYLGLRGFARSEFIIVDGEPHILEINTTPGLTEQSILPKQAKAFGLSLKTLFESAVEDSIARKL
ncbi:D-alanine--D-alanine ligase [Elysia marginata]|uniref:D-alanine--D-alanine ligase n=1 Tax=Elysia marginata TaxID=1093978 RepID=A0AAV4I5N0_9GAST|nr:D-alanine--D-alanine ligase [Elysia marginata]